MGVRTGTGYSTDKKMLEEKVHIWKDLEEYQLQDHNEFMELLEVGVEGMANILRKIKVNQYFVVAGKIRDIRDTRYFQNYIAKLKEEGLDIGRGDAEYGFKMPLPKNGETERELIIFRRR